ncbi:MAG: orotidine 5'-phosphate decarboxylase / HUMPS family protein [Candidatus Bathyarchaeia archaeon]|nr:orotidine 5'-phosphate decarboxylase [Candidatus Bathyarchaeota archaeon]
MPCFKESIKKVSESSGTNLVLALDIQGRDPQTLLWRCIQILDEVAPYICAVKINKPLVLSLSLKGGVSKILDYAHNLGLMTIMDEKLNDVSHINLEIAEHYFEAGFDALIANPFVGWDGGLNSIFSLAKRTCKGVLLLVYMSHGGAAEGYGQTVIDPETGETKPQYIIFAEEALAWGADGAIVGATQPDKVRAVRNILQGWVPIYSPGVIAQGGDPSIAVSAGADYIIVGRAICESVSPRDSAFSLRERIAKISRSD